MLAAGLAMLLGGGSVTASAASTFESGTNPPPLLRLLTAPNTDITGWTVAPVPGQTLGSVEWVNKAYWQAAEGNYSVDLNGTRAGQISATFSGLTAGHTYVLLFFMSGNPEGGSATRKLKATVAGQAGTFSFAMAGITKTAMKYKARGLVFTATAASHKLTFQSLEPVTSPYGPVIDDVRVSEVTL